jgi:hypothetical protein
MRLFILLSIILFIYTPFRSFAQKDSVIFIESDKIIESIDSLDVNPKKPIRSLLFSACLPGFGQAYNKKYWKIPIIYSALGGVGYSVGFYNKQYQKYLKGLEEILRHEIDPSVPLTIFDEKAEKKTVIKYKEAFRRNRDLSALAFLAVYALNIIDATVDAHLSDFDISDDLSLNIEPEIYNSPVYYATQYICLTVSIKFK